MFMTTDMYAKGPAGRTEKMIPLVRKTFGDNMALYADSNSFYPVPEAIRVGRLLEEYKYRYFEEPVMFDHVEEIKQVADALTIPIANGEQDYSFYGFRWLIANDGLEIVQPDNYYFGGLIRSMKVARMAAAYGKTVRAAHVGRRAGVPIQHPVCVGACRTRASITSSRRSGRTSGSSARRRR